MRKEKGVWVLSSKEIAEAKFEGIVITLLLKKEENVVIAKNGYYNHKGNYDTRPITVIAFEKGELDIDKMSKILLAIISNEHPKVTQIPPIAVEADVMDLLN